MDSEMMFYMEIDDPVEANIDGPVEVNADESVKVNANEPVKANADDSVYIDDSNSDPLSTANMASLNRKSLAIKANEMRDEAESYHYRIKTFVWKCMVDNCLTVNTGLDNILPLADTTLPTWYSSRCASCDHPATSKCCLLEVKMDDA